MGRLYWRQLEWALDSVPAWSLRVIDDGRIGVAPIQLISEGIPAMTPTEMEEAIRNLQLQWNRIEQFLPNLATRAELVAQIQEAKRHAAILNEATRDQIELLAENLARVEATMATKVELRAAITGLEEKLRVAITELEEKLRAAITGLEEKLRGAMGGVEKELRATMATKQDLKEAIGGLEQALSGQLDQLASQIARLARRRRN